MLRLNFLAQLGERLDSLVASVEAENLELVFAKTQHIDQEQRPSALPGVVGKSRCRLTQ